MRRVFSFNAWLRGIRNVIGTWRGLDAIRPVPEHMSSEATVIRLTPKKFNGYFSDAA